MSEYTVRKLLMRSIELEARLNRAEAVALYYNPKVDDFKTSELYISEVLASLIHNGEIDREEVEHYTEMKGKFYNKIRARRIADQCDLGIADSLSDAMLEYGIIFEEEPECEGFEALFYSDSALLSHDHNGILNFYNIGAQNALHHLPEKAIGMPSIDLVPKGLRLIEERQKLFERVINERIAIEIQEERITASGDPVEIKAVVFPYELDSKLTIVARAEPITTGNPSPFLRK
ncbi:MAG: PAS domain-containing protein [Candidatus Woesearchaeota archaeon]